MMRKFSFALLAAASCAVVLCCVDFTQAAPAYDFEDYLATPPWAPAVPGFGPDAFYSLGGATITQSTVGVTKGDYSMGIGLAQGDTFTGGLTELLPAPIGNPPGIKSVLFDMTIPAGGEVNTGFAVLGVTVFGTGGLQVQFADIEHIGGKAAGTYAVQIDLDSAVNPLTLDTGSFNEIFGSGVNQLQPTGLYFWVNKTGTNPDAVPVTVYIDNVRTVVPEPASAMLLGLAGCVGLLLRRQK